MAVGHPRKQLAETLRPLLPSSWRVVDSERSLDRNDRTTVIVRQREITKNPAAPKASRIVQFVLTIVSRYVGPDNAEDDLDSTVPTLLNTLDGVDGLRWDTAEKVEVGDSRLGYDITVYVTTTKEAS